MIKKEFLKQQDEYIFTEMFEWNVYQVFEKDIKNKNVLDIGGHIGMFTIQAYELGAKQIIGIEANPINFIKYIQNTKDIKNLKAINAACTDKTGDLLTISIDGVHSQINKGDTTVSTISLTDALELFNSNEDVILKMDVEGAEHIILPNIDPEVLLKKVPIITIEIHGENVSGLGNTIKKLRDYIVSIGYIQVWEGVFFTNTPAGKKDNNDIAMYKFVRA